MPMTLNDVEGQGSSNGTFRADIACELGPSAVAELLVYNGPSGDM